MNGVDANDLPLNTVVVVPNPDAIAEVSVVTNTINPEYGRNGGAILNAETKSGSNQIHSTGFEFYRDTSLNTRNFFSPSATIFHQNQFGGVIGGPIKKNKACSLPSITAASKSIATDRAFSPLCSPNPSFSAAAPYTLGNAGRNFFHGPGVNNFDWALHKVTPLHGEKAQLELRFEFFNLWNHTQFTATPGGAGSFNGSVSGNFASSNFDRSTGASNPNNSRIIQLGAKIIF